TAPRAGYRAGAHPRAEESHHPPRGERWRSASPPHRSLAADRPRMCTGATVEGMAIDDTELAALLDRVIDLALENVAAGHEPFGALVWRDGKVLAEGVNTVHLGDPTAHAETDAVRAAARKVGSPYLTGAVVVASGEPC